MRSLFWTTLISLAVLTGCASNLFKDTSPGNSDFILTNTKEFVDGKVVKETDTIQGNVKQPVPSENDAKISIHKDKDKLVFTSSTGTAQDLSGIQKILSAESSLQPVIFAGIGLIVTSAISFFVLRSVKLSVGILAVGIGLIVLANLLINYSLFFLLGVLLLIGCTTVYLVYKGSAIRKSNEENVLLLDQIKNKISPEKREEIFSDSGLAQAIQSDSTKKIVSEIRSTVK